MWGVFVGGEWPERHAAAAVFLEQNWALSEERISSPEKVLGPHRELR